MILWCLVSIPTLIFIVLLTFYLVVSVTCRPFWQYKIEIRTACYDLYRKLVRDFITGSSRHYVLRDEIALESENFEDTTLQQDLAIG